MKIYCDGIYDLFHCGHVNTFKYIKNKYKDCHLVVGIVNDKDASSYKRIPIIHENNRYMMVESCKYVDSIIESAPLFITTEFIDIHNIDLVVHSFFDSNDYGNQQQFYKTAKDLNKFKQIPYSYLERKKKIINRIKQNY